MTPLAGRGVGIGWRPEISRFVDSLPGLRFVEVIAESLSQSAELPLALRALRERQVAVVPHGIRLSIGSATPVDPQRVSHLAWCAGSLGAPLVSEHLAFVRAGGLEAGHLLPVPRTREAVAAIVSNVKLTQAELDVPIALEPIAALFDWPDDELTEAQFITEILDRTGALLLLDVANVFANAVNRRQDPLSTLEAMPLDRVAYAHVAGGSRHDDGLYHDTHTDPVPVEVLRLIAELRDSGRRPPALMLERDGQYPPAAQLRTELDAIATACGYPQIT